MTQLIIMNGRKREKPYYSRHAPYSLPKRRRPLPLDAAPADTSYNSAAAKAPTSVVVIGVPAECSVLDLKSRFEMYGPISRTRMEPDGVAYINFRSNEAAQSAVDAARDSSFPVTLHSTPVRSLLPTMCFCISLLTLGLGRFQLRGFGPTLKASAFANRALLISC